MSTSMNVHQGSSRDNFHTTVRYVTDGSMSDYYVVTVTVFDHETTYFLSPAQYAMYRTENLEVLGGDPK